MSQLPNPIPQFFDLDGTPLESGYIYVGTAGLDAQSNQINVYIDRALTIPIAQPIRTLAGYPAYQGAPTQLFIGAESCSVTVKNKSGVVVYNNVRADVFISAGDPGGAALVGTATGSNVQAALDGYATRTAIKALTSYAGARVYLTEAGREGEWIFRTGDFSDLVSADTAEGLYLKADDTATTSGAWVRVNDAFEARPEWFGAVGNGKVYNWTTGKWDQNASATNDTAAVHACVQWAARGRKVVFSKWYAVRPATSGTTLDLTTQRVVGDGSILPRRTYIVVASGGGTVTYDGTAYGDGDTFTGETWQRAYTVSGTAAVYHRITFGPHIDMRTFTAGSNYRRYVDITCEENAGLLLLEAGCALGVIASFPNNSMIFNGRIQVNTEALDTLGSVDTIGLWVSGLPFRGRFKHVSSFTNIGGIFSEVWNAEYERLDHNGGGIGYVGHSIENMNSSKVNHTFTHFTRIAGFIRTKTAHGASVGDTVRVSFSGTKYFESTVTKINSTTQLTCDNWAITETPMTAWTATVNGGSALDVIDARSTYGIGLMTTSSEGGVIFADFQNRGGYGLLHIIDGDQGNSSLQLNGGHIEGPSTGVRVQRAASLSGTENLASFIFTGSTFGGRATSNSDFGRQPGIDLDHVKSGQLSGWFHTREYIATAGHATVWAASAPYSLLDTVVLPWGVYICSTAGTSGDRGPVGEGTAISDGTAAWDYVRPTNNTVYIGPNCESVALLDSWHETNATYSGPCNLQTPQLRPVVPGKEYGAGAGPLLINRANITASDGSPVRVKMPTTFTGLTNEKRQPTRIKGRLLFTINAAPASAANRYFGMVFTVDGMNANNAKLYRVTPTEAGEVATFQFDVDIQVSQYRDFLAQALLVGAGWDVSVQLRPSQYYY